VCEFVFVTEDRWECVCLYVSVCEGESKRERDKIGTVSFMDLDWSNKMIIFESLLTTFEVSFIFWDS
jgi:hypothetical protein